MNFDRVKSEWKTESPSTDTPQMNGGAQPYETPSYPPPPHQPSYGAMGGMAGVQGMDQPPPPVRLGRGALPASSQSAGPVGWSGGAQPTHPVTTSPAGNVSIDTFCNLTYNPLPMLMRLVLNPCPSSHCLRSIRVFLYFYI